MVRDKLVVRILKRDFEKIAQILNKFNVIYYIN